MPEPPADLLKRFSPDADAPLDVMRRMVDDSMVGEIAAANSVLRG